MAIGVLIIAKSGEGKSTSIRTLDPKDTIINNVINKPLPFKHKGYTIVDKIKSPSDIKVGSILCETSTKSIMRVLSHISNKLKDVKHVIIDDYTYSTVSEYMNRIDEKSFQKFSDIAKDYWSLARLIQTLRSDLIVYVLAHVDENIDSFGNKTTKFKSVGKLVDNMIVIEGLYTIVLGAKIIRSDDSSPKYVFITKSDGTNTNKSPIDMFEDEEIPNDLKYISNKINDYYGII